MLRRARSRLLEGPETGASLVLTLVFMLVVFALVTALLGFAFSANRTVGTYRKDRAVRYATDSALEIAIAKVKDQPDLGDVADPELCAVVTIDGSTGALPNPRDIFADGSQVGVYCHQSPGAGATTTYRDVTFVVRCDMTTAGSGPDAQVACDSAADGDELGEARVRFDYDPGYEPDTHRARVPKILSWTLNH